MPQQLRMFWSCAVVALAVIANVYAAPVVHEPTGIAFPDEIAGFSRAEIGDYESERRGLGTAYNYRTTTGVLATVYVYTAGLSDVPADISHPLMRRLHEQTLKEIDQAARMHNEIARCTSCGAFRRVPLRPRSWSRPIALIRRGGTTLLLRG